MAPTCAGNHIGSSTERGAELPWMREALLLVGTVAVAEGRATVPPPPDHRRSTLSEHWPMRPSWVCRWCSDPWPCPSARAYLLRSFHDATVSLSLSMAQHLHDAMRERPSEPSGDMHSRFLGWIRHRTE
jgi:hypothetical protein